MYMEVQRNGSYAIIMEVTGFVRNGTPTPELLALPLLTHVSSS